MTKTFRLRGQTYSLDEMAMVMALTIAAMEMVRGATAAPIVVRCPWSRCGGSGRRQRPRRLVQRPIPKPTDDDPAAA